MTQSLTLAAALDALAAKATELGLDAEAARTEGAILAAAVAEAAPGAFVDWCREIGVAPSAESFMVSASAGRKWRSTPTTLASMLHSSDAAKATAYADALGDVCVAACQLGQPTPQVAGAASMASAAQHNLGQDGAMPQPVAPVPGTPGSPLRQTDEQSFLAKAPYILNQVLGQLRATQQNLLRSGLDLSGSAPATPLDLGELDPHAPGAFDLTSPPCATPMPVTPAPPQPAESTTAPADTVQSQEDPNPPAPEPAQPAGSEKSLEELLAELDALTGLMTVKAEIKRQAAILRIEGLRTKEGLKSPTITRHLVFVGNPGTGKTTVARLVAGIYRALGLLSQGQLVEVDRSDLVAGYLGQTAMKTADVVNKAIGGVLFIDEAYGLNGDQYGEEAINTLVKEMEDHRDDLVVIVAGYPIPMAEFISNNPGLASRFRTSIQFDDYSDDELVEIFTGMAKGADYDLGEGVVDEFRRLLSQQVRDFTFGNGRFARNTLEASIGAHAWRLRDVKEPTLAQLRTLEVEDLVGDDEHAVVDWDAAPGGQEETFEANEEATSDAQSPGHDHVDEESGA